MKTAPKGVRLHIGIFGRTNVGKSSFLNMIAGQDVAITSHVAGTTTDVVEKTMELLPLGPVVFLDTAGLNDDSILGEERMKKTKKVFDRSDVTILIVEPNCWTEYEDRVVEEATYRNAALIIVINKIDTDKPQESFLTTVRSKTKEYIVCSSISHDIRSEKQNTRDIYVSRFKEALIRVCPDDFLLPPPLIGDLLPAGGMAVLIVPIDLEAPKGRLILPQVQTIRDALDTDASIVVVKEREYAHVIDNFKKLPDLAVCDSQVVLKMVADTPPEIKCTTFSILFSRFKGELVEAVRGVRAIETLKQADKVLIAESCSHHALEDDIGRVKIPRWIRQYVGMDIGVDVYAGRDYPDNLNEYKLVIHCGACMLTRREMLQRIYKAQEAGVAITNYGICIAYVQGVLERVLSPFPHAVEIFKRSK